MNNPAPTSPRLCYIGPAVRAGLGGPALLYKLLSQYPADRLMLIQTQPDEVQGAQLPASDIFTIPSPPRALGPRIRTLFQLSFLLGRPIWAAALRRRIRRFRPDAILALAHGWIAEVALEIAASLAIPCHLIIHDAPHVALPAPKRLDDFRYERWISMCRRASSRLCVSPFMAEEVRRITGLEARVLYPGLTSTVPPLKAGSGDASHLNFVFAGQIHDGYAPIIAELGAVLVSRGHRLTFHSPQAAEFLRKAPHSGAVDGGWIAGEKLAATLAGEADVLVLPMSFRSEDEHNTRVSFPSKLVEYCAAGRPVLICAPADSSIVRWTAEHPQFALIVTALDVDGLRNAVAELESSELRETLGHRAWDLANSVFSHEATYAAFVGALSSSTA